MLDILPLLNANKCHRCGVLDWDSSRGDQVGLKSGRGRFRL